MQVHELQSEVDELRIFSVGITRRHRLGDSIAKSLCSRSTTADYE